MTRPNRYMTPVPDREAHNALLDEERQLPPIERPFEKIRWTTVCHRQVRPIEQLLGDEGARHDQLFEFRSDKLTMAETPASFAA